MKSMQPDSPGSTAHVRMYTTPWCGYCRMAKRLLDKQKITYEDNDVSADWPLRQKIAKQTGWRTVPMIFVDDRFVGGYTEFAAYVRQHGLDHLR